MTTRLRILEPCREPWSAMGPARDGAGRHCEACESDVHDLRGLSEREALARVVLRGPSVCVRILGAAAAAAAVAAVAACGAPGPGAHASARAPFTENAVDAGDGGGGGAGGGASEGGAAGSDLDTDHDGIPDRVDACPEAPGPADASAARNGCPRVVVVESMGMVILPLVMFPVRGAALLPETLPVIDAATEALKSNPTILRLEVQGHASSDEPGAAKLSEARARAVIARMVARGADPKRLVARGVGIAEPIEDNGTAEGRARNRRVAFRVVETAAAEPGKGAGTGATKDSCPAPGTGSIPSGAP